MRNRTILEAEQILSSMNNIKDTKFNIKIARELIRIKAHSEAIREGLKMCFEPSDIDLLANGKGSDELNAQYGIESLRVENEESDFEFKKIGYSDDDLPANLNLQQTLFIIEHLV